MQCILSKSSVETCCLNRFNWSSFHVVLTQFSKISMLITASYLTSFIKCKNYSFWSFLKWTLAFSSRWQISPVPEFSFLPAPYRGSTRAGERRVQEKCFLSERELKKALRDTLTRAAWMGLSNFLLVRSEHAQASYPGLFFRPPGLSPYMGGGGGKKGEFRDRTSGSFNRRVLNYNIVIGSLLFIHNVRY